MLGLTSLYGGVTWKKAGYSENASVRPRFRQNSGPAPPGFLAQEWKGTGPNRPEEDPIPTGYKENGSDSVMFHEGGPAPASHTKVQRRA